MKFKGLFAVRSTMLRKLYKTDDASMFDQMILNIILIQPSLLWSRRLNPFPDL